MPQVITTTPPANSAVSKATSDAIANVTATYITGIQAQLDVGNVKNYINPPHDPRVTSIRTKTGSRLKTGIMQQTDDWVKASQLQKQPFGVRFLYNPSEIDVAYSSDDGVQPPSNSTSDDLAARQIFPGSTTISWTLLFDRTYEVMYGPNQHVGKDLRKIGVYADIGAFEHMVGVRGFQTDQKGNPVMGNMLYVPVVVIFGGGDTGVGLSYVGWLTGAQVAYTHFTDQMVPVRASLQLQMTQLIGGDSATALGSGGVLTKRGNTTGSGAASTPSAISGGSRPPARI